LPQTRKDTGLDVGRFYTRRFLRIGIPAFAAIIAFKIYGSFKLDDVNNTVLWSVVCEAIYYLLYPVLLLIGRKFGWINVVLAAYTISFVLCITHLSDLRAMGNAYIALGWWTWLVGLPCWVAGCWLAENRHRFRPLKSPQMWMTRISILTIAILLRILKFHMHSVEASNCFTLNAFAFPVTIWIGLELASSAKLGTSRLLEWMGKWSYSIYLVHPIVPSLLASIGIAELRNSEPYLLFRLVVSLLLAYCFYLVIERPGHRIAIRLSRQSKRLASKV